MSKSKKSIWGFMKLIILAGLGFLTSYSILSFSNHGFPKIFNYQNTIISTLFIIFVILGLGRLMKRYLSNAKRYKDKSDLADTYADVYDKKYNSNFMYASWVLHIIWIVAIINVVLVTVFQYDARDAWSFTMLPITLSACLNGYYTKYLAKIDERMSKINNSDYANQVISCMDEGEKYVTYEALFKLYRYNTSILIVIVIMLAVYSIITGMNVAIALFLVLGLYIFNIAFYYHNIGKYYKEY